MISFDGEFSELLEEDIIVTKQPNLKKNTEI